MAHLFTNGILNSFSDTDPNTEITSNIFPLLNPAELDTSIWNIHSIMGFSQDCNFFTNNASEINTTLSTNITPIEEKSVVPSSTVSAAVNDRSYHARNKRKSLETPENSSANSSPQDSEYGITNKNSAGKVIKKQKCNKQNEEKPRDVVHVRARRGQATDSHSLAERVRRGKINERLRCLQDIVPGCHKTVGMAATLDEIINYVQSLQNQVEFLSMKLTAASNFHDFNTETDTMNLMIQKLLRERFELGDEGFGLPLTQHGPPFDLSFGCYHSLPNNK